MSVEEGNKRKMSVWAYDENGWPSGFGNGIVNELGVEYQQKYLRFSETVPENNLIGKCGSRWFYYDINPFYVDVLDKKVISKFIEVAYKPYYDRYGNNFEGFLRMNRRFQETAFRGALFLRRNTKKDIRKILLNTLRNFSFVSEIINKQE